jgi:hypothetical protein
MMPNLALSPLNKPMTKRNLYTYKFLGTIQSKNQRQNPQHEQYFYQLNINCLNEPQIKKIFAFKNKLANPAL